MLFLTPTSLALASLRALFARLCRSFRSRLFQFDSRTRSPNFRRWDCGVGESDLVKILSRGKLPFRFVVKNLPKSSNRKRNSPAAPRISHLSGTASESRTNAASKQRIPLRAVILNELRGGVVIHQKRSEKRHV